VGAERQPTAPPMELGRQGLEPTQLEGAAAIAIPQAHDVLDRAAHQPAKRPNMRGNLTLSR